MGKRGLPILVPLLRPLAVLLATPSASAGQGRWYDGLDGVKVLHPSDPCQQIVDGVTQQQKHAQFTGNRFALLFTAGDYKDCKVEAGFYTSIVGVSSDPAKVRIPHVFSLNGDEGGATQNFWRSIEGVTLTEQAIVWAVSQGAPLRRSIVEGNLYLSDNGGWSSGGFMADVRVKGTVDMGTQQQWFFRNVEFSEAGVKCPIGWNYVFVGAVGLDTAGCQGSTVGKVSEFADTPRIAEKPYLVLEDDGHTWSIYVPAFLRSSALPELRGATADGGATIARKLDIMKDVFVAKPGLSAEEINRGIQGKKGLLFAPGVYHLRQSVAINESGFVVLGLGFTTLISTAGKPVIVVADGLADVRVAGLLLEAGTPAGSAREAGALLEWGSKRPEGSAAGPRRDAGVLSDIFARVGSFQYEGCRVVGVPTMVEINSDDVVMDNIWLWHADHDDCGTASDKCYSEHGLVVNGDRVTVYGLAAEHTLQGNIVQWNGEDGETYFYQCELPYHSPHFGEAGYVGYAVAPKVRSHAAAGLGVYIIGDMQVKRAFLGPPSMMTQSLVTVVIGNSTKQFENTVCTLGSEEDAEEDCRPAEVCDGLRCIFRPREAGERGRLAPPRGNTSEAPGSSSSTPLPTTTVAPTTTRAEPSEFISYPPPGPAVPAPAHRLKVTVVKAKGLRNSDWLGGADPFCVVELTDERTGKRARFSTPQLHNTREPEWNYQQMLTSAAERDSLEFVVLDRDFWKTNMIGRAALTSDMFNAQGHFEGDLPLIEAEKGATLTVRVEIMPDIPGLGEVMQKDGRPAVGGVVSSSSSSPRGGGAQSGGARELLSGFEGVALPAIFAVLLLAAFGAVAAAIRGRARRRSNFERLITVDLTESAAESA